MLAPKTTYSSRFHRALASELATTAMLHGLVTAMWAVFNVVGRSDPRFRRAIADFEGRYQFRAGTTTRRLVFDRGKVRAPLSIRAAREPSDPDFEILFLDLPGAISGMRDHPHDVIHLLLENKIDQTGNKHYLFKLGYLVGLCEHRLRRVAAMVRPGSEVGSERA